jgi:hypothetical protein
MKKTTVVEVRSTLVDYFEEKAAYRQSVAERIAERQPSDVAKNQAYAESLNRMASYVKGLPDDDLTLCALAECPYLYCEWAEMFQLPTGGNATVFDIEAVHCGPRGKPMDSAECAEWFASWAEVVMAEAEVLSETDQSVG